MRARSCQILVLEDRAMSCLGPKVALKRNENQMFFISLQFPIFFVPLHASLLWGGFAARRSHLSLRACIEGFIFHILVSRAPSGASWRLLALPGASWRLLAPPGASWHLLAPPDASWLLVAPPGASWRLLSPPGASWCFPALPGASWFLALPGVPGASWRLPAAGPLGASWPINS